MTFNHYAKLKHLADDNPGWYVVRINEPTAAKNFAGDVRRFDYYYRLYSKDGRPVPYGKFQQLERFARVMNVVVEEIEVTELR